MTSPSPEPAVDFIAAVEARLGTATGFPVCVGEVRPQDITYPHLVIWASPSSRTADRLSGYRGETFNQFQITAVGLTENDCVGAADRASGALHRWRPVIVGRRCGYVEQDQLVGSAPKPLPDPEVRAPKGQTVYSVPVYFTVRSSER